MLSWWHVSTALLNRPVITINIYNPTTWPQKPRDPSKRRESSSLPQPPPNKTTQRSTCRHPANNTKYATPGGQNTKYAIHREHGPPPGENTPVDSTQKDT